MAIGYSGLARIGTEPTDEWLGGALLAANATERSLVEIENILREKLTVEFRRKGYSGRYRLTIAVTGYMSSSPFWGAVSNEMSASGDDLAQPGDEFSLVEKDLRRFRAKKAFVAVTGDLRALSAPIDSRIKKRQRRFYSQSAYLTATQLVTLLRAASRTPDGTTIGRNCTAVVVLPDRRFRCRAYPEGSSPVNFLPNVVLGPVALQRLSFTTD